MRFCLYLVDPFSLLIAAIHVSIMMQHRPSVTVSHFGHSCFVLGLVASSDLRSGFNLRLLPAVTCQLTADSPL